MKLDNYVSLQDPQYFKCCPFCGLGLLQKAFIEFGDLPETLFHHDYTDPVGYNLTRFVYQCQNCQCAVTIEREKYNDNI